MTQATTQKTLVDILADAEEIREEIEAQGAYLDTSYDVMAAIAIAAGADRTDWEFEDDFGDGDITVDYDRLWGSALATGKGSDAFEVFIDALNAEARDEDDDAFDIDIEDDVTGYFDWRRANSNYGWPQPSIGSVFDRAIEMAQEK